MKLLIVVAHPRRVSLTWAVADAFADAVVGRGHCIEWADLTAEGFDPRLPPEDEPDWDDYAKTYSPAVQAEMARILRNEATVMVWPVWWWSMPALMKGWIDRVWNNGWAYGGGAAYPHATVWSLAVAGGNKASFAKRGYDAAIATQIETGILRYCKIASPRQEVLYGSLDGAEATAAIVAQARSLGEAFG